MTATELKLTLVYPEGQIVKDGLTFIALKTAAGELGIYPNHSQLMTTLKPGWVHFTNSEKAHDYLFIPKGFAQVSPDSVKIITDSVEAVSDVDLEKAKEDLDQAENRLTSRHDVHDITEALAARDMAKAKLEIIEKTKK